ncbi:FAD-dependent oxidoreductase, partial [Mesorhizobium sp.]|uniref:FAD-dependent oxidoreductase n=1 Tax=Mesorhizobium sp. TaxID=1871066 RepID=UPI0025E22C92
LLLRPDGFEIVMANGDPSRTVDVIYPCMGCDVRSELAAAVGADCDEEGYIRIGDHLETTIAGLYAIGDVASALNQIGVGFGHAALAATHVHNELSQNRS